MPWLAIWFVVLLAVMALAWAPRDLSRKPPEILDLTEYKRRR